jgi:myo-inositol-1(or 4)-monophosphatase
VVLWENDDQSENNYFYTLGDAILVVVVLLDVIRKAAQEAVGYLRGTRRSSRVIGRGSFGDVTKEFDKVAEDIIINRILTEFENEALIVSEEVGVKDYSSGRPKYVFIIDPVDGSTNYDAGIPWVSVVIGGAELKDGRASVNDIKAAVVADVFGGRIYEYSDESGVKVNGSTVSRREPPAKVLLGYFEVPEAYKVVPRYWEIRGRRAALRSLGSAALDIVNVGLGNAEAFVDARAKLRNVDVAAALKISAELGAKAGTCGGMPAQEIRIDKLVKVECLAVGYDETHYERIARAMNFIQDGGP